MSRQSRTGGSARRRFSPVALLAGVGAALVLALTTTGTLSAFTAQITNSTNTAASGSLVMQETGTTGGTAYTCTSTDTVPTTNTINTNAATCATINDYSGSTTLIPGGTPVVTTVVLKNTGTVAATTFTVTPGACTQANGPSTYLSGSATDFCSKLNVAITTGTAPGTAISGGSGTATALASKTITLAAPVAPGASVTFNFSVQLDTSAGNTYQNLAASQPLVWAFTS